MKISSLDPRSIIFADLVHEVQDVRPFADGEGQALLVVVAPNPGPGRLQSGRHLAMKRTQAVVVQNRRGNEQVPGVLIGKALEALDASFAQAPLADTARPAAHTSELQSLISIS